MREVDDQFPRTPRVGELASFCQTELRVNGGQGPYIRG